MVHTSFVRLLALVYSLGPTLLSGQETIIVMNTHNDGPGSLRQAIFDASTNDTIVFDVRLDGAAITLTDDQLSIDRNLTIDASSLGKGITIDANANETDKRRILEVQEADAEVTLTGITFVNGYGPNWESEGIQHVGAPGGAILNFGTLVLTDCSFFDNQTSNGSFSGNPSHGAYEESGVVAREALSPI